MIPTISRRDLLRVGVVTAGCGLAARSSFGAQDASRQFTIDLRCGSIGVRVDQLVAIRLAAKHGFQSVTPRPDDLISNRDAALELLKAHNLKWGAAGLPVEFRQDESTFRTGMMKLPAQARALQNAGVTRVGTWLRPNHADLTYMANFQQHARRLRECAKVLADHGQRFGLEYVGPKTLWASARHSFVHTMAETKDLIAEIGLANVGFIVDSWHWYTAHETVDDLKTLTNDDIVACDLNDAPRGIAIDEQIDNRRELPAATGVIDLKAFLGALVDIGYDGPVRAEPFNRILNEMGDDDAVSATAESMRAAFRLIS